MTRAVFVHSGRTHGELSAGVVLAGTHFAFTMRESLLARPA